MRLTVQLTERGEALTERIADLADGLPLVVDLRQGQGVALARFTGTVEPLVELAIRVARTTHTIQRITRSGDGYVVHLAGQTTTLALVEGYLRGVEGGRVRVQRA